MATEGGLFEIIKTAKGYYTRRAMNGSVYGLSASAQGLAIASAKGVYVLTKDGRLREVGFQVGAGEPRFGTVQWHAGDLFAGGLDGLYRFAENGAQKISSEHGFSGGWVTALKSQGSTLYIGTYDSGVYEFSSEVARRHRNLREQWVPPHALGLLDGQLFVGGLGMPAVLVKKSGTSGLLSVPARDVNGFIFNNDSVSILTSDGRFEYRSLEMKAQLGGFTQTADALKLRKSR